MWQYNANVSFLWNAESTMHSFPFYGRDTRINEMIILCNPPRMVLRSIKTICAHSYIHIIPGRPLCWRTAGRKLCINTYMRTRFCCSQKVWAGDGLGFYIHAFENFNKDLSATMQTVVEFSRFFWRIQMNSTAWFRQSPSRTAAA